MSAKLFLVFVFALVAISECHGQIRDLKDEAVESFRKIFVLNFGPMAYWDTFNAFERMRTNSNDEFIMSLIDEYMKPDDAKVNQCTPDNFTNLDRFETWFRIQDQHDGKRLDEGAAKVQAFTESLFKLCQEEFNRRLEKAQDSMSPIHTHYLNDLNVLREPYNTVIRGETVTKVLDSSFVGDLARFVKNIPATQPLEVLRRGKYEIVDDRYQQVYRDHIIEPCRDFQEYLKPAAKIAEALAKTHIVHDSEINLLKQMRICDYAIYSMTESLIAAKKLRD